MLMCAFSTELENRGKWGPRGILCTRGEKAQTSKRVSVIVCDNVISKAKLCDAYTRIFRTLKETSKIHQIIGF